MTYHSQFESNDDDIFEDSVDHPTEDVFSSLDDPMEVNEFFCDDCQKTHSLSELNDHVKEYLTKTLTDSDSATNFKMIERIFAGDNALIISAVSSVMRFAYDTEEAAVSQVYNRTFMHLLNEMTNDRASLVFKFYDIERRLMSAYVQHKQINNFIRAFDQLEKIIENATEEVGLDSHEVAWISSYLQDMLETLTFYTDFSFGKVTQVKQEYLDAAQEAGLKPDPGILNDGTPSEENSDFFMVRAMEMMIRGIK